MAHIFLVIKEDEPEQKRTKVDGSKNINWIIYSGGMGVVRNNGHFSHR